jgi:hypothetical protein
MKKLLSLAFVMAAIMMAVNVQAQTYKYRQVKVVNRNTGEEYDGGNVIKYITFSNNKSSFTFTNMNGRPVNSMSDATTSWWCYMNYAHVPGGTGISSGFANLRVFKFESRNNQGVLVYRNNRSYTNNTTGQVGGYITDYINFASDYSRFNVISGGSDRENGVSVYYQSIPLCQSNEILVFERVENANTSVLY